MSLSLDPGKLKRYKDIALLIFKYGNKQSFKLTGDETAELNRQAEEDGKRLADDLENLGPTFIKLGQLLSTRPDFLPPAYIKALTRLQDNVEPFPFEQVEAIIKTELGARISKAFSEFDEKPLAAASLGQVHRARLRNGIQVAVKVQRPNIKESILKDIEAIEDIAGELDKHTAMGRQYMFKRMLQEFKKSLLKELDYNQEAANLTTLKRNLRDYKNIVVPQPVIDYTTERVLTMEFISGKKVTSLTPLGRLEIDGKELAGELFNAYLDQILVDGFFHADPHPGNVFLTDDKRIALIDLGMTARLEPELREKLLKLLITVSEGKGKEAAELALQLGTPVDDAEEGKFIQEVSEFVAATQDITLERLETGRVLIELTRIAGSNGFRLNTELTMLGKTLLNLDEIGKTLDPEFDPNAAIREHAQEVFEKHLFKSFSPGSFFSSVIEMREFLQKLPGRLNQLFDSLTKQQFEVKVKAFDEISLMVNLQKIANRIATGLILAALIVGAALMMRVGSAFTIFGYPGIAMIMFLIAAALGLGLVISIFVRDEWKERRKR